METILLLIEQERNLSLLQEFLADKYEVIIPQNDQLRDFDYDLIIMDQAALKKFGSKMRSIKDELSVFLPLVLVTANLTKKIRSYVGDLIDELIITPIKKHELKLRIDNLLKSRSFSVEAQQRYNRLAENSPVGICVIQEEEIVYTNPVFKNMSGLPEAEVLGKNFFSCIHSEDEDKLKDYLAQQGNCQETKEGIELRCITAEQDVIWVDLRMAEIIYDGIESKLLILLDITPRKEAQKKINYLNFHDRLTDLYNRAYFKQELKRLDTKRQLPLSLIMADVNGLKLVNDAFGHQAGDQLLQKVADILRKSFREEDIITRWGGDEFVILLPQTTKEAAEDICLRIKKACANNKQPVQFSISLGVATKDKVDMELDKVINRADDRMYKNKLKDSSKVRNNMLSSLEKKLRDKTYESDEHINRIKELALKLGAKINLSEIKLEELELLARLHDIGKVSIPERILKKEDSLTAEEWETVQEHTEIGYNILKSIPKLAPVAKAVLSHQEWWDGSGYPQGLSGKDIPILSRILSIVDAYDVMTHKRSYNHLMSQKEAVNELKDKAGEQFDPNLVEEFIKLVQKEE